MSSTRTDMSEAPNRFDPKHLLLFGSLISVATAMGLYVAYRMQYQQVLKCHVDSTDIPAHKSCKKMIEKSQLIPDMSLEQSKMVCQENEDMMGFDWDPKASVFYNSSEDEDSLLDSSTGACENDKCDKKLTETEGTGRLIACVKIAERKRGYFIGSIVTVAVALVMLVAWLILWKQQS